MKKLIAFVLVLVMVMSMIPASLAATPLTLAGKVSVYAGDVVKWTSNCWVWWTSGNTGVATIDQQGNIKALRAGQTHITATAADGTKKTVMLTVYNRAAVAQTTINLAGKIAVYAGDSIKWTSNCWVWWTSGNTSVATIDQQGNIKALRAGQTHITATAADGAKKTVMLTVYAAPVIDPEKTVTVSGKNYALGMSAAALNTPDEKLSSASTYTWYVYGTTTYKDFIALGVENNEVVAIAAAGMGFLYNGNTPGEVVKNVLNVAYDENDNNKVHGVFIGKQTWRIQNSNVAAALAGESKMNFHYTNAFRVMHGKKPLLWSAAAATSARLHSEDMAENNYFSHTSLDGGSCSQRMEAQEIKWRAFGENIYAGSASGFEAYDGWVNSSGHRRNMLNDDYSYLGVGSSYNLNSHYGSYMTQNFYDKL